MLFFFVFSFGVVSAQLPSTDLYMFSLLNNGDRITLKKPVYLSGFNPDGYNNQPNFISPTQLYITSNHYDKDFTDFMRLDLIRDVYYRITETDSISEFSPTSRAMAGYFSAVRIEKDAKTQSLWLYPEDHSNSGKRLFENIDNVGYHCWLSEMEVALCLVSKPTLKLAIGNVETGIVSHVLEDIGKCFRQDSNGDLLFVHKVSEDSWYIKSWSIEDKKATTITPTRPKSEEFTLLSDGTILMGEGSKVYSIHPSRDEYWKEVKDLSDLGITDISRLAVSRNKLILVSDKKSN